MDKGLVLNKTNLVVSFSIDNVCIDQGLETKLLGIITDNHLAFAKLIRLHLNKGAKYRFNTGSHSTAVPKGNNSSRQVATGRFTLARSYKRRVVNRQWNARPRHIKKENCKSHFKGLAKLFS